MPSRHIGQNLQCGYLRGYNRAMTNIYQLTEQQERFCEHYAIHSKPSEAYKNAYSTSGWTSDMISTEAYRTRKIPHLALRIMELKTDSREAFKVTVAEKKQWLKQIVEMNMQCVVDETTGRLIALGDHNAAKGAINELNKMDGDHATVTTKQEITADIGTRALTADEYKTARDEMLKDDDC